METGGGDMRRRAAQVRPITLALWFFVLCILPASWRAPAEAADALKAGSRGPYVALAQHFLYQLGFLELQPDGIFGPATEAAVRRFQAERGLGVDGIVGRRTWAELEQAVAARTARAHVVQPGESLWLLARRYGAAVEVIAAANGIGDPSRIRAGQVLVIPAPEGGGEARPPVELLHWDEAKKIYTPLKVATVTDVRTGKSFKVRRYYGTLHADTEPLTAEDAEILREIYGGWSWERRPIIVEVDGRRIAASMNGMPHGEGAIGDNGFPGHFCIHFLGSRIHRTGAVDLEHQKAVLTAAGYAVDRIWLAAR